MQTRTALLAVLACLLWSTAFAAIKIGLQYIDPLQFAGTRFFISGLLILPFIPSLLSHLKQCKACIGRIALIGILQTTIHYALFYTGLSYVPAALAALLIGSGPLFVLITAHFLMPGDLITRRKLIGIIFGLSGVAIITLSGKNIEVEGNIVALGIAILLVHNIIAGFGTVLVARSVVSIHPLVLSSLSMIIGGLALFITGILIEGYNTGPFPVPYYASLAWLSFLSAAAVSIWYTLLKKPGTKLSELNMWKFIIPVFGAILSWLMLAGEKPDIYSVTGMVLIAFALISINYQGKKRDLVV